MQNRSAREPILCAAMAMAFAAAPVRAGQAPPDYGLDWVTIGDPGNRGTLPEEAPGLPPGVSIGSVPYKYRMTRTEITVGQWYEFVLAYAPFHQGPPASTAFTGLQIDYTGGSYVLVGNPDNPTVMGWEYAARLANWYGNGKVNEAWAFESGAYDTSTFYIDDEGVAHHQAERSPGATYWLPNLDEWTKGSHWSPTDDRYWYRQGSQDEPLISGFPQDGGETNAGPNGGPFQAGSYPDVQSPWGLLDTSGGVRELTETIPLDVPGLNQVRHVRGSGLGTMNHGLWDSLDFLPQTFVTSTTAGLRLASAIPTPGACVALGLLGLCSISRRRR